LSRTVAPGPVEAAAGASSEPGSGCRVVGACRGRQLVGRPCSRPPVLRPGLPPALLRGAPRRSARATAAPRARHGCCPDRPARAAPSFLRGGCARRRHSAPGGGGRGASRTPPRTPGEARDRGTRVSLRWGGRRRGRSLKDLRCAVASLEADLVGSRGTGGSVVEVDEEVGVDLHAAARRAVDSHQP
jgi:hypothetical protein